MIFCTMYTSTLNLISTLQNHHDFLYDVYKYFKSDQYSTKWSLNMILEPFIRKQSKMMLTYC